MKATLRLGRIAGIDIGIHYSWFGVLALITWSLATGFLPTVYAGWSSMAYWLVGLVAALLLFVSVLVHEMAHSIVARRRGVTVNGITLFLLGGVSNLNSDAQRPRDEFLISVAGPAMSLVLSGLFGGAWFLLRPLLEAVVHVDAVVAYLALINLLLAAFNMIPAFPLDGGRVLRSVLWGATGNVSRATRIATIGGQILGFGLIGLGIYQIVLGNVLGGIWFGFIGWFLQATAAASRQEHGRSARANAVTVGEIMERDPEVIAPSATVSDLVYGHMLGQGSRALPVCDGDGELVGVVTLGDVRGVPQYLWGSVTVQERMTPTPLWTLDSDDDLKQALMLLAERSIDQAPVLWKGRLVGMIRRADILRHLHYTGR